MSPAVVIGGAAVARTLAWRTCAFRDLSFPAALSVKGRREAFLSVKASHLLTPQD